MTTTTTTTGHDTLRMLLLCFALTQLHAIPVVHFCHANAYLSSLPISTSFVFRLSYLSLN